MTKPMTIDDHGIIRDPFGAKVAVFKDPSLGQRFIDRAGLLSADEAARIITNADNDHPVQLRRVLMWEVVDGH